MKKIVFSFLTILFFFLLLELLAKGLFFYLKSIKKDMIIFKRLYSNYSDYNNIYYKVYPYSIFRMNDKNLEVKKYNDKINSYGFRDDEFSKLINDKYDYRIICVGGSTTFGTGVNNYMFSYPKQLEQFLNNNNFMNKKFQVINGGIPFYTTKEILISLIDLLSIFQYKVDFVIIYEAINDYMPRIYNNYKADYSHFRKILETFEIPFIYKKSFLEKSDLFLLIRYKFTNFRNSRNLTNYFTKTENYSNIDINFEKNGLSGYINNIRTMISICKANDIIPILVNFIYWKILKLIKRKLFI